MKLSIERAALAELMTRGGSTAERNGVVPILSHVRLIAENGTLRATTTNLDMQADAVADASVDVEGSCAVDASALKLFVDRLPAKAVVKMEQDGARLAVSAGRTKARFGMLLATDLPNLDVLNDTPTAFRLTGAELSTLFARTASGIAKDGSRPYLEGVFLHLIDGGRTMRAVATNGHMLLCTTIPSPEGAATMPANGDQLGVIVSAEAVAAALRLYGRDESVGVRVSPRGIVFEGASSMLATKLVEGTYPAIDRVIPQVSEAPFTVDKASAVAAIAAIEVFHAKDAGHIIECAPDADGLAMAAGAGAEGDGFAIAQAEFDGEVQPFGVSSRYLKLALAAFNSESITLSLADPASPIRFTAERDSAVLGVVMPMRITAALVNSGVR